MEDEVGFSEMYSYDEMSGPPGRAKLARAGTVQTVGIDSQLSPRPVLTRCADE